MRSFAKLKPSRKFPNLQYIADMCDNRMGNMSICLCFCGVLVWTIYLHRDIFSIATIIYIVGICDIIQLLTNEALDMM